MNLPEFCQRIKIGDRELFDGSDPFIIAEAGVNHNGDMALARKMVDAAKAAGAGAVKFQAYKTENLILSGLDKAPYQVESTGGSESQFQMLKQLELPLDRQAELAEYCHQKSIVFLTTPFDEETLDGLDSLRMPAIKVASTDVTNLPYLLKMAKKGKPILLSTGMSDQKEIDRVLSEILPINNRVVLLQCTSDYPVKENEVNLRVIREYRDRFRCLTGFSDHTAGIGAAPYAVSLGAVVIEKHFTLDRRLPGPDQSSSLEPGELKQLVEACRRVHLFLGSSKKEMAASEIKNRNYLQKCLVASRDISAGERFSLENVMGKRTGGVGISALLFRDVEGRIVKRNFKKDEIIE